MEISARAFFSLWLGAAALAVLGCSSSGEERVGGRTFYYADSGKVWQMVAGANNDISLDNDFDEYADVVAVR